jgi:hypothetical protein
MNPLDQLADISTPTEVSIWPLAWGYWLAIVLLLLLVLATATLVLKHLKRTKQKRNALTQLNALDCSDTQYIPKAQLLLKQVCSVYFPGHQIKTMHGSAWQQFLLNVYCGANIEQIKQAISLINQYLYAAKPEATAAAETQVSVEDNQKHLLLKAALVDFIKTSTPPSKTTNNKLASSTNSNKTDDDTSVQGSGKKQETELAHV